MKNLQKTFFLSFILWLNIGRLQAQIDPDFLVTIHTVPTTIEMNAIHPSIGALIFNTETSKAYIHDGTNWISIGETLATPDSIFFADRKGTSAEDSAKLFYDDTNNRLGIGTNTPTEVLEINGNISVIGGYKDSNKNLGTSGQILSSTVTGTNWINNSLAPPFVTNSQTISPNQTTTLTFTGINFIPSTSITFPGFSGTINSITVVSPRKLNVNVTADATTAVYDVVLSNNGTLNTSWPGNGVNSFLVKPTNRRTLLQINPK